MEAARDRLIDLSLIAFEDGRYQVLELPETPTFSTHGHPSHGGRIARGSDRS